jgi:hypothetical protein
VQEEQQPIQAQIKQSHGIELKDFLKKCHKKQNTGILYQNVNTLEQVVSSQITLLEKAKAP